MSGLEDSEDASYRRYALRPSGSDLDEIRAVLRRETAAGFDFSVAEQAAWYDTYYAD